MHWIALFFELSFVAIFRIGVIGLIFYFIFTAWRAFSLSRQALRQSMAIGGERGAALLFLAVNLCQPLFHICLITYLFLANSANYDQLRSQSLLSMVVLLLPILGMLILKYEARKLCFQIVANGILRLVLASEAFARAGAEEWVWVGLLSLVNIWVLYITVNWVEQTLAKSLWGGSLPAQPAATSPALATLQAARPALSLSPRVAAPLAPPMSIGPLVACPVCREISSLHESACPSCGLVFVSRLPPTLHSLGRYTALRPLSDGGMSSVYLARDSMSGRLCVLKTLVSVDGPSDSAWRAQAARCLDHEATLLSQIEHPRVARLLDRVAAPLECLVLEYIPGPTLADRIATERPQPREAIGWALQTAELICELAELPEPLLHLDIKPANLILPPDRPGPVLVDFGGATTARLLASAGGTGLYGTPGYAAPEQYRGLASSQSDVYGLATTLYHALSGDDPSDHPMVFPALHSLPPAQASLLSAALAYDPAERPTPLQLYTALRIL